VRLNKPALAAVIGVILLGTIVLSVQAVPESDKVVGNAATARPLSQSVKGEPSSTARLGRSMFTEYLFMVELAGTLLLVATIGSIAVAQRSLEVE
jgi:NADH-quinone oxidoreductase subunit J